MTIEPINIFSHRIDPDGVLALIRREASSIQVEGADSDWTLVSADIGGATLVVGHSRDFYAGPGWPAQVSGMAGYFLRFPHCPAKPKVMRVIRTLRFALSFPAHDIDLDDAADPRVRVVFAIAEHLGGVIFTPSALRDAGGRVLLGPPDRVDPTAVVPELPETPKTPREPLPDGLPPERVETLTRLEGLGFRPARWLPFETDRALRPTEELARRLIALDAIFTWVAAPEEHQPSKPLRDHVARNSLEAGWTDSERELFAMDRGEAHRAHAGAIGWRLENMWPLAWALGFEDEPRIDSGMIREPTIRALQREFLPPFAPAGTVEELLTRCKPRSAKEVDALEDLYYCAHNAVRSAQLGEDTVPEGFDPMAHGGVVHERRHALTWMLSPGVSWDDTDLNT